MPELFLISDTHFGHKNILSFTNHDGTPLRPFESLTEMHIKMIENWNSVVSPKDKVYHLGDVAFSVDGLNLMQMLNGKKRLVRGNHDLFKISRYARHFEEVYGVRQIDGYWLTHVPMHPHCVDEQRVKGNIHGHLHSNTIPSQKWLNVSVEQIDYTPISFDVAIDLLKIDGKEK